MIVNNTYAIEIHSHRFSAWAASRAASVKGCRFRVEQGREILEGCGFVTGFSTPDNLPEVSLIDKTHREWRCKAIELADRKGLTFTHGVAAKLINCYLKSRLVCAGYSDDPKVSALHPPIDKILLEELAARSFGGERASWKRYSRLGWSNFNSEDYETLISLIQKHLNEQPLWMIEEHWVGNQ